MGEQLERGEDQRLWSALLRWFRYIRPTDIDKLAGLIERLFQLYPVLSKTREAAMMLAHKIRTLPGLVGSVAADWMISDAPRVQQAGGELVALAALSRPELAWPTVLLSSILANGEEDARVGVAYAAVKPKICRRRRSPARSSIFRPKAAQS